MRIVTWNIHAARDAPLEDIARELRGLAVDVACLNEVRRSHGTRLGRLAGLRAYVASSWFGPYGNAILTNLPVVRRDRFRFDGVRRVDRRDGAMIELPGGTSIVAVHLNSLRPADRIRNAAQLVSTLPEGSIVAGDMNEGSNGPAVAELAARFADACPMGEATFPAEAPDTRIDLVWVPHGTRVHGCRVVPTKASDHLPVIVEMPDLPRGSQ